MKKKPMLNILFYALLIVFVLCVYRIDKTRDPKEDDDVFNTAVPEELSESAGKEDAAVTESAAERATVYSAETLTELLSGHGFSVKTDDGKNFTLRHEESGNRFTLRFVSDAEGLQLTVSLSIYAMQADENSPITKAQYDRKTKAENELIGDLLKTILAFIDQYEKTELTNESSVYAAEIVSAKEKKKDAKVKAGNTVIAVSFPSEHEMILNITSS